MTTVKQMVVKALTDMGADGLCNYECGCWLNDFLPCGDLSRHCIAGKSVPASEEYKAEYKWAKRMMVPFEGKETTWNQTPRLSVK